MEHAAGMQAIDSLGAHLAVVQGASEGTKAKHLGLSVACRASPSSYVQGETAASLHADW